MTETPPLIGPASGKKRLLLVTGVLGGGKTTALRALEDLGWEIIDNLPIRMLERLLDHDEEARADVPLAIGFDARTRGFHPQGVIDLVKRLSRREDIELTTLYLDCGLAELERRYNETRRRHHLSTDLPVASGVAAERELMEPLRRWADMVITTTAFSTNDLQQAMRERFAPEAGPQLTLTITSFGFSRGMPPVADFIFDMRFLNNPHWDLALRPMTGKDAPIGDFIRQDPGFADAFARIRDLLLSVIPRFQKQGKSYVHIAFGCTGGRHRSVFMAEQIGAALRDSGFSPTMIHRNLGSRAADLVEGGAAR